MASANDFKITRYGVPGNASQPLSFPIGANVTVAAGAFAVTDTSGNIKDAAVATVGSADTVWGVIGNRVVNASTAVAPIGAIGADGLPFWVETGSFYFSSGTGVDALTQANVGKTVYMINETTVGATSAGSRSPAGILINIDTTQPGGYAVKVGSAQSTGAPQ
jgi:hypothetical protein